MDSLKLVTEALDPGAFGELPKQLVPGIADVPRGRRRARIVFPDQGNIHDRGLRYPTGP